MSTSAPALIDALRRARADGTVLELDGAPSPLPRDVSVAVAEELYRRDAADSAWKMGALDEETQRRLGLDGPLVAPVLASGLHTDAAEVRLRRRDFVQPRLEAEIGIQVRGSSVALVPCVEVADCRVPGWTLASGWAVADFGLQGAMVFGAAREPVDVVRVDVLHDGQLVDGAERSWTDAVDRLRLLSPSARDGSCVVATGAMTPLVDAAPGRWDFRFHGLQTLTLHIS